MQRLAVQRPYSLSPMERAGNALCIGVFVVILFFPPLLSGYRFRLDHFVLLLTPAILFTGAIRNVSRPEFLLFLAACMLAVGQIVASLLQFIPGVSSDPFLLVPAVGATKTVMVALLFVLLLRTPVAIPLMTKLVAIAILFHGAMAWFEYTTEFPWVVTLMDLYGTTEYALGHRAIGLFDKVHSLAYFLVYGVVFLTMITSLHPKVVPRLLYFAALIFATLGVAVSFSRAAYLMLAVALVYAFVVASRAEKSLILIGAGVCVSAVIASGMKIGKIESLFEDLVAALVYMDTSRGFVAGRLDHGIRNAIEIFSAHPLYGSLAASSQSFAGDNGYLGWLAYHGLIGAAGWVAWTAGTVWVFYRCMVRHEISPRAFWGALVFLFTILLAATATQPFTERSADLIPVYLVVFATWAIACQRVTGSFRVVPTGQRVIVDPLERAAIQ